MKMTKNLFITLLFLTSAIHTHTMDQPEPKEKKSVIPKWVKSVGTFILGEKKPKNSPDMKELSIAISELPKEIQNQIIGILLASQNASSLIEASQTISSFAQVNKELHELINQRDFCLKIIKNLSARFNCSNLTACKALQTQKAKKQLELQTELFKICQKPTLQTENWNDNVLFAGLIMQGVDFEFTYDYAGDITTPLIIALLHQSEATDVIITVGKVDVTRASKKGTTPLEAAEATENKRLITLIQDQIKKQHKK